MGCPDWPRCFGLLAPPTCACQLPANYQDIFLQKRIAKVEKFTATLDKLGFHAKAQQIRQDKNVYLPEAFNAQKAWIEYINRIFGVISGLLMLLFALLSIRHRKVKGVLLYAMMGLIMLVLNAWLGSIVVATNLLPGIVSVHFMLSFLCIFFVLVSMHRLQNFQSESAHPQSRKWWLVLFISLMVEVLLGTWAREQVELLTYTGHLQLENGMLDYIAMGIWFAVHRFLPGAIFLGAGWMYFQQKKISAITARPFMLLAAFSLFQICFGAFNIVFALPPWSQIIHIVVGSFLPVYAFYQYILKQAQPQRDLI